MGELEQILDSVVAIDWAMVLRHPAISMPVGVFFGVYGLGKLVRVLGRLSRFGDIPYNKSYGVTCVSLGNLNISVSLLVLVLLLEPFVELGSLFGAAGSRVLHYSEAARVLGALAATAAFILLARVLLAVTVHRDLKTAEKRFSKLHDTLKDRGFGLAEVFGVPLVTLGLNVGPWVIKALR